MDCVSSSNPPLLVRRNGLIVALWAPGRTDRQTQFRKKYFPKPPSANDIHKKRGRREHSRLLPRLHGDNSCCGFCSRSKLSPHGRGNPHLGGVRVWSTFLDAHTHTLEGICYFDEYVHFLGKMAIKTLRLRGLGFCEKIRIAARLSEKKRHFFAKKTELR